jgi:hypothetical protein
MGGIPIISREGGPLIMDAKAPKPVADGAALALGAAEGPAEGFSMLVN